MKFVARPAVLKVTGKQPRRYGGEKTGGSAEAKRLQDAMERHGTQCDAVLCFAVHVSLLERLRQQQHDIEWEALTVLQRVSRHCADEVRQEIGPCLVQRARVDIDAVQSGGRPYRFLAVLRFIAACRLEWALWCQRFMGALCRLYLDSCSHRCYQPVVACYLLTELMQRVVHGAGADGTECTYNCALCPVLALQQLLVQLNASANLCNTLLLRQEEFVPSFSDGCDAYSNYQQVVDTVAARLALALQRLNVPLEQRTQLESAFRHVCARRFHDPLERWLRRVVDGDEGNDLYALLMSPTHRESPLYDALQRQVAHQLCRSSGAAYVQALVEHFFQTYVASEQDWLTRPAPYFRRLRTALLMGRGYRDDGGGPDSNAPDECLALRTHFLVGALQHLCATHRTVLPTPDAFTRVALHQLECHNHPSLVTAAAANESDIALAVDQFVTILQERDAYDVMEALFAMSTTTTTTTGTTGTIAHVARQRHRRAHADTRRLFLVDLCRTSCDPYDIFLYQGVRQDDDAGVNALLQDYFDAVTPVIADWTLDDATSFLQQASAVLPPYHWSQCLPRDMQALLACHYRVRVMRHEPTPEALHGVVRRSALCMRELSTLRVFADAGLRQWIDRAVAAYVVQARSAMFSADWRCQHCLRDYGDASVDDHDDSCLAAMARFYARVVGDAALLQQLQSLASEYVQVLLALETAATGGVHCVSSNDIDNAGIAGVDDECNDWDDDGSDLVADDDDDDDATNYEPI